MPPFFCSKTCPHFFLAIGLAVHVIGLIPSMFYLLLNFLIPSLCSFVSSWACSFSILTVDDCWLVCVMVLIVFFHSYVSEDVHMSCTSVSLCSQVSVSMFICAEFISLMCLHYFLSSMFHLETHLRHLVNMHFFFIIVVGLFYHFCLFSVVWYSLLLIEIIITVAAVLCHFCHFCHFCNFPCVVLSHFVPFMWLALHCFVWCYSRILL